MTKANSINLDAYGPSKEFQAVDIKTGATNVNFKGARTWGLYWDGAVLKLERSAGNFLSDDWILAQSTGFPNARTDWDSIFWGDVLASAWEETDKPAELRKVVWRRGAFWGEGDSPYHPGPGGRLWHLHDLLETGWYKVGNLWQPAEQLQAEAMKMRAEILQRDIQASLERGSEGRAI